jgi:Prokaryotic E2 family E
MDVLGGHLNRLREEFPGARVKAVAGANVLVVPDVPVASGWNRHAVTIRVIVPAGYPHAHPDCFYVESDVMLASGAQPSNSALQALGSNTYRWFSWHLGTWDGSRDELLQFVRSCQARFRDLR